MAWCRQATSHYLSQCWLRSMSPYGVTWPQVNSPCIVLEYNIRHGLRVNVWTASDSSRTDGTSRRLLNFSQLAPSQTGNNANKSLAMTSSWNGIGYIRRVLKKKNYSVKKIYDNNHYRQTSNTRSTLVGNKIADHSDVVGTAPTTSSFSTSHQASMDWAKTTARRDEQHLSFGIWRISY